MGESERNTNMDNTGPTGNSGRSNSLLSALDMHGKGNRSAISKELRKLALLMRNVKNTDDKSVKSCVKPEKAKNDSVHETSPACKTDFSKIDEFISAEGETSDLTIDDIIRSGAPSGDYFSEDDFIGETGIGDSAQISSIDSFLEAVRNGDLKSACSASDDEDCCTDEYVDCNDETGGIDESFYTESLAKIYIKQRRYDKALEIINKLSLIYPEKNIYFADQIRFLKKLIDNIKTE